MIRTRIALGLAIVPLMIGKLEVRDSLLVVAIALVVGVATMLSPGLRRRRLETGQHAPPLLTVILIA